MKRSKHSLSSQHLLSFDMGELVPIGCTEIIPGDSIQQMSTALARVSPLVSPVMSTVWLTMHHWFVPHRLTWTSFEDFITGGADNNSTPTFPTVNTGVAGGFLPGSLGDYLGAHAGEGNDVSALPFRAYNLIWNEFYRDQDLQDLQSISTDDGKDTTTNLQLLNACWLKDYFTTARPWPQKGEAVTIPLGATAPVTGTTLNSTVLPNNLSIAPTFKNSNNQANSLETTSTNDVQFGSSINGVESELLWQNPNLAATASPVYGTADLSQAQGVSIDDLRLAFGLQRYAENRSRFGSRYSDMLAYYGITSPDARLQRPEYLGGSRDTIKFSEVLQTAPGTNSSVGDLYGHGIGMSRSRRFRRFFPEHGYIISLACVRPKALYTQGSPRHWWKKTKEDFFHPELQHIGQQELYNGELYDDTGDKALETFGYQNRYDEYRHNVSDVSGEFRSTLDYWHLARKFAGRPILNDSFVKCVPTKRVFADQNQDAIQMKVMHSIQARRMVSKTANNYVY